MSSIRFTGAADRWVGCLPLGDGRLGAMTDGGIRRTTLHLNDVGAWSGSPTSETEGGVPDAAECARLLAEARAAIAAGDPTAAEAPLRMMQTRYAQSYLPLGEVTIDLAGSTSGPVRRSLDLRTGIHRSTDGEVATTTFIEPEHSVLVHAITGPRPAPEAFSVTLTSPLRGVDGETPVARRRGDDDVLLLRLPSDVAPGHEPDLPSARWDGPSVEAALVVRVLRENARTIVLIATATTFAGVGAATVGTAEDAWADASARLDRVAAADADLWEERTAARLRGLLGSVELQLEEPADASAVDTAARFAAARADPRGAIASDPALVSLLFDYGRYLLVCASRPGGPPATLQGIWNADMRPPWGSAYTLNINTEMNHWGAQVTGLADCAEPLTAFTLALADRARAHTRRLYGAPGWTVHHNSDAWLYATTPGRGAGDPRWSFWPMGGAWLSTLLVEGWEFGSSSVADLARIWPALRAAAEFTLAWHRDGQTSPATSPENAFLTADGRPGSLATTSTMDLSLIRAQLRRTTAVAAALGHTSDPVSIAAATRLQELPEQPRIGADGTILEWDRERQEEDPHHRHVSALYGLFPGDEPWDADHRVAAATTLTRRGDDSSGWSLTWKLALWARLERPDRVSALLSLALRDAEEVSGPWAGGLYPNLLAAHPPFQIDANLGVVGAIAETLLQSHDGIHLLPALPRELASGRVTGLIARPGVAVDIEWCGGELVTATLRARSDRGAGEHRVRWRGRVLTVPVESMSDTVLTPDMFPLPTSSPQEVRP